MSSFGGGGFVFSAGMRKTPLNTTSKGKVLPQRVGGWNCRRAILVPGKGGGRSIFARSRGKGDESLPLAGGFFLGPRGSGIFDGRGEVKLQRAARERLLAREMRLLEREKRERRMAARR